MEERDQNGSRWEAAPMGSVYQNLEKELFMGIPTQAKSKQMSVDEGDSHRLPLKFLFRPTPQNRLAHEKDLPFQDEDDSSILEKTFDHRGSSSIDLEKECASVDLERASSTGFGKELSSSRSSSIDIERASAQSPCYIPRVPSPDYGLPKPYLPTAMEEETSQERNHHTDRCKKLPASTVESTKDPDPPSMIPSSPQQTLQPSRPQTAQLSSPKTLIPSIHQPPSRPQTPEKPHLTRSPPRPGYLAVLVTTHHTDLLMLTCCLISGLVDSAIYNAYGTFVSMQTGNTIFLGLGGSTGHTTSKPYGWAKSLASISCFCLGCFFFSHCCRILGGLRRGTLITSFLLQAFLIGVAAASAQVGIVEGTLRNISTDVDWHQLIPIGLLSFQSAGQIVGSRTLGLTEIPTVVLTSTLHDISTDPALAAPWQKNVKRNRRVVAFFAILAGAVAGGFIAMKTGTMQFPLWIAGGLKLGIVGAWILWPAKEESPV